MKEKQVARRQQEEQRQKELREQQEERRRREQQEEEMRRQQEMELTRQEELKRQDELRLEDGGSWSYSLNILGPNLPLWWSGRLVVKFFLMSTGMCTSSIKCTRVWEHYNSVERPSFFLFFLHINLWGSKWGSHPKIGWCRSNNVFFMWFCMCDKGQLGYITVNQNCSLGKYWALCIVHMVIWLLIWLFQQRK